MDDHRRLRVWQNSIELVKVIYQLVCHLPSTERFNLSEQMRRSALSIPSNIAEGAGCGSSRDYARFLIIARGSARELETQLIITSELGFINTSAELEVVQTVIKQLNALIRSIQQKLA